MHGSKIRNINLVLIYRKIYSIVILLLLVHLYTYSQAGNINPNNTVNQSKVIQGQLIDHSTKVPVPFATIVLKGYSYGIITNENGTFNLVNNNFEKKDTVQIRALGYETLNLPISTFSYADTISNIIFIKPAVYEIDNVIIKSKRRRKKSAGRIVQIALANLEANYPVDSFLIDGYYRDYLKTEDDYLNLFESRIQIEDKGFYNDDYSTSKMRLVSGGMNPNFTIDTSKIISYSDPGIKRIPGGEMNFRGGNELSILRLADPLRNRDRNTIDYINYIRRDMTRNHTFWHKGVVYYDDRPIYKLGFKTNFDVENSKNENTGSFSDLRSGGSEITAWAEGEIFIDSETYTIHKISYVVNAADRIHGEYKIWELNEEYKLIDGLAYLSYLSYNNAVELPDYADSVYFHLENIFIENNYERIVLEFNNSPNIKDPRANDICRIKIADKWLDFERAEVKDSLIYLYPKSFEEIFSGLSNEMEKGIDIRLKKIKDYRGNVCEEYKFIIVYQYREFFVRDIQTQYEAFKKDEVLDNFKSIVYQKHIEATPEVKKYFNSTGMRNKL